VLNNFFWTKIWSEYFYKAIYIVCKKYVDQYNGQNDGNMISNGEFNVMTLLLPRCAVVLDIGANQGEWSKKALSINSNLELHCFEPSCKTFERLTKCNFPINVKLNNLGVSSCNQMAQLKIFSEGSALNSLYQRVGLEDGYGLEAQTVSEKVLLTTLDDYCNNLGLIDKGIDFCKVDVEGHELEVFKGMRQLLSSKAVQFLQFEYGGCNIDSRVLLRDVFYFFEEYEYVFYKIFPEGLLKVARYDQRFENFQYQNWLIVRSNIQLNNLIKKML